MNIVAEILVHEPATMAIWASLLLLTLPAVVLLASPVGMRHPVRTLTRAALFVMRTGQRREERRIDREQRAIRAARYAEEVGVAAEQAGYAVSRWQEHWAVASELVDTTAVAWHVADARWTRSRVAVPYCAPWTPQTPAEYADRENFLHRTVRSAVERGDLPVEALSDAVHGRGGWDPRLHPVRQELAVHRACAGHLERALRAAVAAERSAWHDLQLARRSRDSLRHEALVAEAQAALVRHLLPAAPAAPRAMVPRPALAPVA
ncbi:MULTISPECIES: hypothetical protein [Actinoplanes]|uniref:hypothetical protein n=1 Tax=Actinoplanes TaxID=1865 RepID=UPI0006990DA6|nr:MULTISPECIES: hypothetical protein [Actinoplanes]GLY01301.1 hypothetical protein Acsp01_16800 [Actinoplanes sp. NBRC 101535]